MKYKHGDKVVFLEIPNDREQIAGYSEGDVATILVGEYDRYHYGREGSKSSYDFKGKSPEGWDISYIDKITRPYNESLKEMLGDF